MKDVGAHSKATKLHFFLKNLLGGDHTWLELWVNSSAWKFIQ